MKTPRVLTEDAPQEPVALPRPERPVADMTAQVRCPLCRFPLVARMTQGGPRFLCACEPAGRTI
jgi:hypothetical protein